MWKVFRENKSFKALVSYGSLFTSMGTLLCCAIPSTLVLLGLGASLANFIGEFPQLVWLSDNKEWVFGISLSMLTLSFAAQRYSETQFCPVDKKEDCEKTKSWAKPVFYLSALINVIGAIYAFLLPRLFV